MRSKYIVIEGLEGAGKTTARNVVIETLKTLGVADMVFTREPGGTQLAEKLRSLVLDIKSVGRDGHQTGSGRWQVGHWRPSRSVDSGVSGRGTRN